MTGVSWCLILIRSSLRVPEQLLAQRRELGYAQGLVTSKHQEEKCKKYLTFFSYPSLSKRLKQARHLGEQFVLDMRESGVAMTVSDIAPAQNIALRLHHKYLITEGKRNV